MKLISCDIRNFGKLHNRKFEFNNMLETVKENNSWGKTTLAVFILSMFYGLPPLRNKNISENERRRYDPWQGGVFGGSLVFEYNEKRYQLERDFNKKDDGFQLVDLDTKRLTDKINAKAVDGKNIGELLFGLNKNSFIRSIYIPQGDIAFNEDKDSSGQIEGGLNEKLRNLINATDGQNNFNRAVEILEKAEYSIESKSGKGELYKIVERLKDLENKIEECNILAANADTDHKTLDNLKNQLKARDEEIEKYDQKIKQQGKAAALYAQQEHYRGLKNSINNNTNEIKRLESFFRGQRIQDLNLAKIKSAVDEADQQENIVQNLRSNTQIERKRLENIETEKAMKKATRENLITQMQGIERERNKNANELSDLEKQKKRPGGFRAILFIILCILTLGLILIFIKRAEARLATQIAECKSKLAQFDQELDIYRQKLESISPIEENPGSLDELNKHLEREEARLKSLSQEVDNELGKFNCQESDNHSRYMEIKKAHEYLAERYRNLQMEQSKFAEFMQGKDEAQLQTRAEGGQTAEQLQNAKKDIENQKEELISRISGLKIKIDDYDTRAASVSDYIGEKEECEQQRQKLRENLDIIRKTKQYLNEAKDNLSNEYLAPIKEKCRELVKLFDPDKAILDFDADSTIKIREEGKDRELDYFSRGNKEMISLCMRFALIDVIYKESNRKPCVILDDPFVNLDDTKLEKAKDFLRKLAGTYQIIYLTCHDSRVI